MPIPSAAAAGSPPPKPLNRRREKFCGHYALTGNAAEAARLAGYAERSANNHGFRLIGDPRVRERIYAIRVNRAIQFGPVTAFSRLENLYRQASQAGAWRAAAFILTLQARLAGVESWNPPPVKSGGRPRRGAFGPRGADPFDDLSENGGSEMTTNEGTIRLTYQGPRDRMAQHQELKPCLPIRPILPFRSTMTTIRRGNTLRPCFGPTARLAPTVAFLATA